MGGDQEYLTWLFLGELSFCGKKLSAFGRVIAGWFSRYCDYHSIVPDVLPSLRDRHSGIGATEKEEARKERLFENKVEQLAKDLHHQHDEPPGGHVQFLVKAREQLGERLKE